MSHRGSKAHADAQAKRAMRNQGYADGRAGRQGRYRNAEYQQGWRRGVEARNEERKGIA